MAKKIKQSSIVEPTEAELTLFQQLVQDIHDGDLDVFANEYFGLVQKEEINISFAKFVIDKIVRPVKPGDTINYTETGGKVGYLYCLIRQDIEDKTYLLFGMVDEKGEVVPEMVYLFHVTGKDETGMEILDIMESSEEAERILDIMESEPDVEILDTKTIQKEE